MHQRFMSAARLIALSLATLPGVGWAQNSPADLCLRAYESSMTTTRMRYDDWTIADSLYNRLCSTTNRSNEAGFDTGSQSLINAVPGFGGFLSGSMKVTSNKSFCETYDKRRFEHRNRWAFDVMPVVEAHKNFNDCMKIASDGQVFVSHVADPETLTVYFDLRDNRPIRVEAVRAPGATCYLPGGDWLGRNKVFSDQHAASVTLDEDSNIICKREIVEAPEDGAGASYATVHLQVATSAGPYSVTWFDETVLSPTTRRESAARIAELEARASQAEARLQGIKLTTHKFYVHEGDIRRPTPHPLYGMLYPTNDPEWHRDKGAPWWERVNAAICPDAELVATEHNYAASGDCCGHNYYVRACVEIPD